MNVFHPRYDNLFVAGMIQPDSGIWGLAHYQSQLIARAIQMQKAGDRRYEQFQRLKAQTSGDLAGGIRYLPSQRHKIEVEHFSYRRELQRLLRRFS